MMKNKYSYSCVLTLGNIAIAEREIKKESLIKILGSFYCKDYKIEKIINEEDKYDYYYLVNINFENYSRTKVQRFTESLISFSLFWNISIEEW